MLEWTPEEASLLHECQSTSQGNMGDSEPPDILYHSHCTINLQLHVHLYIIEKLHDQSFCATSEDSLRASKPPVTGYQRTKGQES